MILLKTQKTLQNCFCISSAGSFFKILSVPKCSLAFGISEPITPKVTYQMCFQNNGNRIKCYQNAIKATYDTRKSQCLCGLPGLPSLFVLVTGGTFLNGFRLSFMRIWPVFSLSYTVSLPFLIFCCQFVARIL